MTRFRVQLEEEAQNLLDTLVEVFDSSRSAIIEDLILDYVNDYANSRKEELEAWIEAQEEDEDFWLDPDEAQEEEEEEDQP